MCASGQAPDNQLENTKRCCPPQVHRQENLYWCLYYKNKMVLEIIKSNIASEIWYFAYKLFPNKLNVYIIFIVISCLSISIMVALEWRISVFQCSCFSQCAGGSESSHKLFCCFIPTNKVCSWVYGSHHMVWWLVWDTKLVGKTSLVLLQWNFVGRAIVKSKTTIFHQAWFTVCRVTCVFVAAYFITFRDGHSFYKNYGIEQQFAIKACRIKF